MSIRACCGADGAGRLSNLMRPLNKDEARKDIVRDRTFTQNLEFLKRVPLFARLPASELPRLVSALTQREYPASSDPDCRQTIITEGTTGDEFFLIRRGEAEVMKNGLHVATLKGGDYFGEASLQSDSTGHIRNATVRTSGTALSLLSITRSTFQALGLDRAVHLPRRQAVVGEDLEEGVSETSVVGNQVNKIFASETEQAAIVQGIERNEALMGIVTRSQVESLAQVAYKMGDVQKGTVVIQEKDFTNANKFFVVEKGEFLCYKKVTSELCEGDLQEQVSSRGQGKSDVEVDELTTYRALDSFGERSLMYNEPRAATVECLSDDSALWVIDRRDFRRVLREKVRHKLRQYVSVLEKVDVLHTLLQEEKEALSECLTELHFQKGQDVLVQGTAGEALFILYQGDVVIRTNAQGRVKVLSATQENCPYFGEQALIKDDVRNATVTVDSATAVILSIDRTTFENLLGPLKELMRNKEAEARPSFLRNPAQWRPSVTHPLAPVPSSANKVSGVAKPLFKNLKLLGVLGCGGFGSVTLQQDATTRGKKKAFYAMKKLSKGYIVQQRLQRQICSERLILSMTDSQFIVRFFGTYNIRDCLYFLLEACLGGELFAVYNTKNFYGSTDHAKFYVACVVKAFHHLHERKIIYRDLKPENLLLDKDGWLKVTDMGLAKFTLGRTYTTCGTPDYFAPELVYAAGHTVSVDWWTLGILLYELMAGHPPFDGQPALRYKKILRGIEHAKFPDHAFAAPSAQSDKPLAKDLILKLCAADPADRLPMLPGGVAKNLEAHRFFEQEKWEKLESRTLKTPYVPKFASKSNPNPLEHFSHMDASRVTVPSIPYVDPQNGWDRDFF
ncbi:unnamed protein product [Amoebophrya sp. A120]|nr:unnamed protein product [Amoebophrya sp. A120]|eukprot:GSA120T00002375001.1